MSFPKRKAKLKAFKYCFFIGSDFNVFVENDPRSLLVNFLDKRYWTSNLVKRLVEKVIEYL